MLLFIIGEQAVCLVDVSNVGKNRFDSKQGAQSQKVEERSMAHRIPGMTKTYHMEPSRLKYDLSIRNRSTGDFRHG